MMDEHERITCKYCENTVTAPEGAEACFACWELYEEPEGPQ